MENLLNKVINPSEIENLMSNMITKYLFRRRVYKISENLIGELVYIQKRELKLVDNGNKVTEELFNFDTVECDGRELPLSNFSRSERKIIQENNGFKEEIPLTEKQKDYLLEHYTDNLFAINELLVSSLDK